MKLLFILDASNLDYAREWKMSGPTQTFDHSISGSDNEVPLDPAWGKLLAVTKTCSTILLKEEAYTFGRGKTNDIVLEHPGISGSHCKIWREPIEGMDKYTVWIEDYRLGAKVDVGLTLAVQMEHLWAERDSRKAKRSC